MIFPKHVTLHITHNQHKSYYLSLADYIEQDGERFDFKDDDAKARAIAADELWEIQWYPNTPVGFCCVAAPTLDEALALANQP